MAQHQIVTRAGSNPLGIVALILAVVSLAGACVPPVGIVAGLALLLVQVACSFGLEARRSLA